MNKKLIISLAILSLSAFSGCERISSLFGKTEQQQAQMPPPPVSIIEAQPVSLPVRTNLPGRLEPFRQAEVRARVSGILLKREYDEGQDVKEGELLFRIDPAQYEAVKAACVAAVQRAKANLANIADKEEKYRPLVEKGSISEREHTDLVLQKKMAEAELASANAELQKAELELGYTKVTSPITGRARAELVTEGALVGHGTPTPLTTVEQLDPIYVKFTQPASEITAVKHGVREDGWKSMNLEEIPIELVMSDGSSYKRKGKLVFSDMAVNPDTDTVQMKAVFDNPDYELIPGAYVRIRFDSAVRQSVYLIPRAAVMMTGQGTFVMVVGEGNIVQMRPVKANELEGSNWIVTDGLKPGDKVIVERGLMVVQPGMPVTIDKVLNKQSNKGE